MLRNDHAEEPCRVPSPRESNMDGISYTFLRKMKRTPRNVQFHSRYIYNYLLKTPWKQKFTERFVKVAYHRLVFLHSFCVDVAEKTNKYLLDFHMKEALVAYVKLELELAKTNLHDRNYIRHHVHRLKSLLWLVFHKFHYFLTRSNNRLAIWEMILRFMNLELSYDLPRFFNEFLDDIDSKLPDTHKNRDVPYYYKEAPNIENRSPYTVIKDESDTDDGSLGRDVRNQLEKLQRLEIKHMVPVKEEVFDDDLTIIDLTDDDAPSEENSNRGATQDVLPNVGNLNLGSNNYNNNNVLPPNRWNTRTPPPYYASIPIVPPPPHPSHNSLRFPINRVQYVPLLMHIPVLSHPPPSFGENNYQYPPPQLLPVPGPRNSYSHMNSSMLHYVDVSRRSIVDPERRFRPHSQIPDARDRSRFHQQQHSNHQEGTTTETSFNGPQHKNSNENVPIARNSPCQINNEGIVNIESNVEGQLQRVKEVGNVDEGPKKTVSNPDIQKEKVKLAQNVDENVNKLLFDESLDGNLSPNTSGQVCEVQKISKDTVKKASQAALDLEEDDNSYGKTLQYPPHIDEGVKNSISGKIGETSVSESEKPKEAALEPVEENLPQTKSLVETEAKELNEQFKKVSINQGSIRFVSQTLDKYVESSSISKLSDLPPFSRSQSPLQIPVEELKEPVAKLQEPRTLDKVENFTVPNSPDASADNLIEMSSELQGESQNNKSSSSDGAQVATEDTTLPISQTNQLHDEESRDSAGISETVVSALCLNQEMPESRKHNAQRRGYVESLPNELAVKLNESISKLQSLQLLAGNIQESSPGIPVEIEQGSILQKKPPKADGIQKTNASTEKMNQSTSKCQETQKANESPSAKISSITTEDGNSPILQAIAVTVYDEDAKELSEDLNQGMRQMQENNLDVDKDVPDSPNPHVEITTEKESSIPPKLEEGIKEQKIFKKENVIDSQNTSADIQVGAQSTKSLESHGENQSAHTETIDDIVDNLSKLLDDAWDSKNVPNIPPLDKNEEDKSNFVKSTDGIKDVVQEVALEVVADATGKTSEAVEEAKGGQPEDGRNETSTILVDKPSIDGVVVQATESSEEPISNSEGLLYKQTSERLPDLKHTEEHNKAQIPEHASSSTILETLSQSVSSELEKSFDIPEKEDERTADQPEPTGVLAQEITDVRGRETYDIHKDSLSSRGLESITAVLEKDPEEVRKMESPNDIADVSHISTAHAHIQDDNISLQGSEPTGQSEANYPKLEIECEGGGKDKQIKIENLEASNCVTEEAIDLPRIPVALGDVEDVDHIRKDSSLKGQVKSVAIEASSGDMTGDQIERGTIPSEVSSSTSQLENNLTDFSPSEKANNEHLKLERLEPSSSVGDITDTLTIPTAQAYEKESEGASYSRLESENVTGDSSVLEQGNKISKNSEQIEQPGDYNIREIADNHQGEQIPDKLDKNESRVEADTGGQRTNGKDIVESELIADVHDTVQVDHQVLSYDTENSVANVKRVKSSEELGNETLVDKPSDAIGRVALEDVDHILKNSSLKGSSPVSNVPIEVSIKEMIKGHKEEDTITLEVSSPSISQQENITDFSKLEKCQNILKDEHLKSERLEPSSNVTGDITDNLASHTAQVHDNDSDHSQVDTARLESDNVTEESLALEKEEQTEQPEASNFIKVSQVYNQIADDINQKEMPDELEKNELQVDADTGQQRTDEKDSVESKLFADVRSTVQVDYQVLGHDTDNSRRENSLLLEITKKDRIQEAALELLADVTQKTSEAVEDAKRGQSSEEFGNKTSINLVDKPSVAIDGVSLQDVDHICKDSSFNASIQVDNVAIEVSSGEVKKGYKQEITIPSQVSSPTISQRENIITDFPKIEKGQGVLKNDEPLNSERVEPLSNVTGDITDTLAIPTAQVYGSDSDHIQIHADATKKTSEAVEDAKRGQSSEQVGNETSINLVDKPRVAIDGVTLQDVSSEEMEQGHKQEDSIPSQVSSPTTSQRENIITDFSKLEKGQDVLKNDEPLESERLEPSSNVTEDITDTLAIPTDHIQVDTAYLRLDADVTGDSTVSEKGSNILENSEQTEQIDTLKLSEELGNETSLNLVDKPIDVVALQVAELSSEFTSSSFSQEHHTTPEHASSLHVSENISQSASPGLEESFAIPEKEDNRTSDQPEPSGVFNEEIRDISSNSMAADCVTEEVIGASQIVIVPSDVGHIPKGSSQVDNVAIEVSSKEMKKGYKQEDNLPSQVLSPNTSQRENIIGDLLEKSKISQNILKDDEHLKSERLESSSNDTGDITDILATAQVYGNDSDYVQVDTAYSRFESDNVTGDSLILEKEGYVRENSEQTEQPEASTFIGVSQVCNQIVDDIHQVEQIPEKCDKNDDADTGRQCTDEEDIVESKLIADAYSTVLVDYQVLSYDTENSPSIETLLLEVSETSENTNEKLERATENDDYKQIRTEQSDFEQLKETVLMEQRDCITPGADQHELSAYGEGSVKSASIMLKISDDIAKGKESDFKETTAHLQEKAIVQEGTCSQNSELNKLVIDSNLGSTQAKTESSKEIPEEFMHQSNVRIKQSETFVDENHLRSSEDIDDECSSDINEPSPSFSPHRPSYGSPDESRKVSPKINILSNIVMKTASPKTVSKPWKTVANPLSQVSDPTSCPSTSRETVNCQLPDVRRDPNEMVENNSECSLIYNPGPVNLNSSQMMLWLEDASKPRGDPRKELYLVGGSEDLSPLNLSKSEVKSNSDQVPQDFSLPSAAIQPAKIPAFYPLGSTSNLNTLFFAASCLDKDLVKQCENVSRSPTDLVHNTDSSGSETNLQIAEPSGCPEEPQTLIQPQSEVKVKRRNKRRKSGHHWSVGKTKAALKYIPEDHPVQVELQVKSSDGTLPETSKPQKKKMGKIQTPKRKGRPPIKNKTRSKSDSVETKDKEHPDATVSNYSLRSRSQSTCEVDDEKLGSPSKVRSKEEKSSNDSQLSKEVDSSVEDRNSKKDKLVKEMELPKEDKSPASKLKEADISPSISTSPNVSLVKELPLKKRLYMGQPEKLAKRLGYENVEEYREEPLDPSRVFSPTTIVPERTYDVFKKSIKKRLSAEYSSQLALLHGESTGKVEVKSDNVTLKVCLERRTDPAKEEEFKGEVEGNKSDTVKKIHNSLTSIETAIEKDVADLVQTSPVEILVNPSSEPVRAANGTSLEETASQPQQIVINHDLITEIETIAIETNLGNDVILDTKENKSDDSYENLCKSLNSTISDTQPGLVNDPSFLDEVLEDSESEVELNRDGVNKAIRRSARQKKQGLPNENSEKNKIEEKSSVDHYPRRSQRSNVKEKQTNDKAIHDDAMEGYTSLLSLAKDLTEKIKLNDKRVGEIGSTDKSGVVEDDKPHLNKNQNLSAIKLEETDDNEEKAGNSAKRSQGSNSTEGIEFASKSGSEKVHKEKERRKEETKKELKRKKESDVENTNVKKAKLSNETSTAKSEESRSSSSKEEAKSTKVKSHKHCRRSQRSKSREKSVTVESKRDETSINKIVEYKSSENKIKAVEAKEKDGSHRSVSKENEKIESKTPRSDSTQSRKSSRFSSETDAKGFENTKPKTERKSKSDVKSELSLSELNISRDKMPNESTSADRNVKDKRKNKPEEKKLKGNSTIDDRKKQGLSNENSEKNKIEEKNSVDHYPRRSQRSNVKEKQTNEEVITDVAKEGCRSSVNLAKEVTEKLKLNDKHVEKFGSNDKSALLEDDKRHLNKNQNNSGIKLKETHHNEEKARSSAKRSQRSNSKEGIEFTSKKESEKIHKEKERQKEETEKELKRKKECDAENTEVKKAKLSNETSTAKSEKSRSSCSKEEIRSTKVKSHKHSRRSRRSKSREKSVTMDSKRDETGIDKIVKSKENKIEEVETKENDRSQRSVNKENSTQSRRSSRFSSETDAKVFETIKSTTELKSKSNVKSEPSISELNISRDKRPNEQTSVEIKVKDKSKSKSEEKKPKGDSTIEDKNSNSIKTKSEDDKYIIERNTNPAKDNVKQKETTTDKNQKSESKLDRSSKKVDADRYTDNANDKSKNRHPERNKNRESMEKRGNTKDKHKKLNDTVARTEDTPSSVNKHNKAKDQTSLSKQGNSVDKQKKVQDKAGFVDDTPSSLVEKCKKSKDKADPVEDKLNSSLNKRKKSDKKAAAVEDKSKSVVKTYEKTKDKANAVGDKPGSFVGTDKSTTGKVGNADEKVTKRNSTESKGYVKTHVGPDNKFKKLTDSRENVKDKKKEPKNKHESQFDRKSTDQTSKEDYANTSKKIEMTESVVKKKQTGHKCVTDNDSLLNETKSPVEEIIDKVKCHELKGDTLLVSSLSEDRKSKVADSCGGTVTKSECRNDTDYQRLNDPDSFETVSVDKIIKMLDNDIKDAASETKASAKNIDNILAANAKITETTPNIGEGPSEPSNIDTKSPTPWYPLIQIKSIDDLKHLPVDKKLTKKSWTYPHESSYQQQNLSEANTSSSQSQSKSKSERIKDEEIKKIDDWRRRPLENLCNELFGKPIVPEDVEMPSTKGPQIEHASKRKSTSQDIAVENKKAKTHIASTSVKRKQLDDDLSSGSNKILKSNKVPEIFRKNDQSIDDVNDDQIESCEEVSSIPTESFHSRGDVGWFKQPTNDAVNNSEIIHRVNHPHNGNNIFPESSTLNVTPPTSQDGNNSTETVSTFNITYADISDFLGLSETVESSPPTDPELFDFSFLPANRSPPKEDPDSCDQIIPGENEPTDHSYCHMMGFGIYQNPSATRLPQESLFQVNPTQPSTQSNQDVLTTSTHGNSAYQPSRMDVLFSEGISEVTTTTETTLNSPRQDQRRTDTLLDVEKTEESNLEEEVTLQLDNLSQSLNYSWQNLDINSIDIIEQPNQEPTTPSPIKKPVQPVNVRQDRKPLGKGAANKEPKLARVRKTKVKPPPRKNMTQVVPPDLENHVQDTNAMPCMGLRSASLKLKKTAQNLSKNNIDICWPPPGNDPKPAR